MMIFNARTLSLLNLVFTVYAMTADGQAEVVSATKNGITIAAEASVTASGKAHITCSLTNSSPHTLASVRTHSPSTCFQFKLLDADGNQIPQEKPWSRAHYQDESSSIDDNRGSLNRILLAPSERTEFQFSLDDAYGASAAQGRTLEVKWRNSYSGPESSIDIGERKNAEGIIIPAHREKVSFPNVWTITVTLPLPKIKAGTRPPSFEELTAGTARGIPQNPPTPTGNKTPTLQQTTTADATWHRKLWWSLLLIPVLLASLGLRLMKKT